MDYSIDRRETAVVVAVRGRVDESSWEAFGEGLEVPLEEGDTRQ